LPLKNKKMLIPNRIKPIIRLKKRRIKARKNKIVPAVIRILARIPYQNKLLLFIKMSAGYL